MLPQQHTKTKSGIHAVRHFTTNQKIRLTMFIARKKGKTNPQLDMMGYLAGLKWVLKTQTIMPNDIIALINTNI